MINLVTINKYPSSVVGFLQAITVAAYVLLFATTVTIVTRTIGEPPQIVAITFFLIAFVFSALVCGTALLSYPLLLIFQGKVRRAAEVIGWSILTLLSIGLLSLAVLLAFS